MEKAELTAAVRVRLEHAAAEARAFESGDKRRARLAAFGARLNALGGRNMQAHTAHERLRARLVDDVQNRRPFSLLRLGDGEGNTLFWDEHRGTYPVLAELGMERILRLMFGRRMPPPRYWDCLSGLMRAAVENVTYAGIPTPTQTFANLDALANAAAENFDLRGRVGVAAVWDWLSLRAGAWLGRRDRMVLNWHVHRSLLRFSRELIQAAGNASVVSCYPELLSRVQSHFGVTSGEDFLIPPQAGNIRGTPEGIHYPDVYESICTRISARPREGQLFLIGAGILGKSYCEMVRKAGGMAIDMGSMMDVWMGLGVRVYQNAEFVAANRLQAPDGTVVDAKKS